MNTTQFCMFRRFNDPNPVTRCAVCLYSLGLGYNRISKAIFGTNRKRQTIYGWLRRGGRRKPTLFKIPLKPRVVKVKPPRDYEVILQRKNHRRLKKHLRKKVWLYFKHGLHPKSARALIGCSREQFRTHIAGQFKRQMSFDNYASVWELDHIVPCAAFNLFDITQRLEAFHFSNFQPLEAPKNRRKSAKISNQSTLKLEYL